MKLLFITPRLTKKKNDLFGSGIPYWPLEIIYFVSWLEKKYKNIKCNVLDLFSENINKKTLKHNQLYIGEDISLGNFDTQIKSADYIFIYCISLMALSDIELTIKYIKTKYTNKKIILIENTQAVTAFSLKHESEKLFNIGTNYIILGELYENWEEILKFIKQNKSKIYIPENILIKNLKKKNQRLKHTRFYDVIPNWDKIKYYNYWKFKSSHGPKKKNYIPLLTSRGCPYGCDFCVSPEITGRNWTSLSPEDVVNHITHLKKKYNVNNFFIEDLNPTVQSKRWKIISNILVKNNLDIKFFFVSGTKLETIKINQLNDLSEAGCEYISFSPESGSKKLMKIIGKKFDYSHGLNFVRNCKHNFKSIRTQACFVIGHPKEKFKDFILTFFYMIRLTLNGLDEIAVFIISPFSGSKLSNLIKKKKENDIYSFSPSFRKGYIKYSLYRFLMIIAFLITKLIRDPIFYIDIVKVYLNKKEPYLKIHNLINLLK